MKGVPVWTAVTCALLGSALPAQQISQSSRTVLATVSAGNRLIVDLDVDDFVIEEAGAAREVFDVHVADYPLVIILDDSRSDEIATIREAAARFVTRVGDRAVAVGTLSRSALLGNFDADRAEVLDDIKSATYEPTPQPVPLQALSSAVRLIQEAGAPFSAIVVISAQAIDTAVVDAAELLSPIVDSRIPVHVIAQRPAARSAVESSDLLRDISNLTHGQYTTIYTPASYAIALDRLADRLSTEMMIQFLVPPGAASGEVKVGVRIPGARVTGLGVSR